MKGLDQCLEHKRVFMFHCEDHEDLCCEICAFSFHRKCENIHEIAKVAKNVKDTERKTIRASIITASEVIMKCKENQLNNVSRVEEIEWNGTGNIHSKPHSQKDARQGSTQTDTLLKNDFTVKVELKINGSFFKTKNTNVSLFSLNKTQVPKTTSAVRLELLKTMDLVNTGDDKREPFVTGLDFLPDGRIVAVDSSNCKCFILNDTLKRLDTFYKFKTYPRDVTSYSDNNIAITVSAGDIRTVCLLTVGSDNTITLMKTLTTSTYCYSICPLNDRTFVVSTMDGPRPVRFIDVDGKESDVDNVKFPGKTYTLDESRCTNLPFRNSLVLTDRFAHTVYMYNTVSGKITEVKDDRIREPTGACVGPDDSVFVCSENTNSVIPISPDGYILTSCDVDMKFLCAVAVSRDGSRMAVTNSAKGFKKLKLFKMIQ
ncbi:uncharacterized protein LOC128219312 [Mya arenaria]|uniref:uncharacterized protein LOC128219312 n=1 Tax=Mya arenaria TaxID=6604 RepID=UPI0022E615AD|nr:uncharacterized protein LOC128219312 [Mya arenaria]